MFGKVNIKVGNAMNWEIKGQVQCNASANACLVWNVTQFGRTMGQYVRVVNSSSTPLRTGRTGKQNQPCYSHPGTGGSGHNNEPGRHGAGGRTGVGGVLGLGVGNPSLVGVGKNAHKGGGRYVGRAFLLLNAGSPIRSFG